MSTVKKIKLKKKGRERQNLLFTTSLTTYNLSLSCRMRAQEFDPNRAAQLYGSPAAISGGHRDPSETRDMELKASLGFELDDQEYVDEGFSDDEGGGGGGEGRYVPSTLANNNANVGASPGKMAMLVTTNQKLEREVASLRNDVMDAEERVRMVEAKSADEAAVKANALKHLQAAEDHVGLLLTESRNKLEAMAAENEQIEAGLMSSAAGGRDAGDAAASAAYGGGLNDEERMELDLLRGEVKEYISTQAEMDAEAEEREGELKRAYEHIVQLQEAVRQLQNPAVSA